MAQVLKDEVQESITRAAVAVFARRGYRKATIGEIAAEAGISTGNVYRYFEGKAALFDAVVSADFARTFRRLLRRRVESLDGVDDVRELEASHLYHLASEDLLRFCIDNRLRVVILLGRAEGSPHEGFAEQTVQDLMAMAIAHFRGLQPEMRVTRALRFNLGQIYHSFVHTMMTVLASFDDEAAIREIVGGYTRYHLAGLNYLFEGAAAASDADDAPRPGPARTRRKEE